MSINKIIELKLGTMVTADFVANISGTNKMQGIHVIKENSRVKGVAILCTLNGENYNNEWIVEGKILKYYLKGVTTDGEKRFKEEYSGNKDIIESNDRYDIYIFIRNSKKEKFKYIGEFKYNTVKTESDGAKYFILLKKNVTVDEIITDIDYNGDLTEDEFPEGKKVYRMHSIKERNPRVINKAKEKFKAEHDGELFCEICKFNFKNVYGDIGEGFIEGHHRIPISELKDNAKTKVDDIVLLCSNCHKMIHRKRPWLTKESIQKLIVK